MRTKYKREDARDVQFRESIAFSKDLITGKVDTLVKKKPLFTPIRGFAKVELFWSAQKTVHYENMISYA